MMRYFFADFIPSEGGGFEPRLPEGAGGLLLADSGMGSAWGVFDVGFVGEDVNCEGLIPLDDDLQGLIWSAEGYSPALAIARDETEEQFKGTQASREDFARFYGESIRRQLQAQDTSGFLLAKAVHDEIGYLRSGCYYWIVEYIPKSRSVMWVSEDFFVYQNPASHFDVPQFRLMQLARWRLDRSQIAEQLSAVPSIEPPGAIKATELQRQIDQAVAASNAPIVIRLGRGSEETDLTSVADVRAKWAGCRARSFTVASQKWIGELFTHPAKIDPADVYAVGRPLIIVKEINAGTIVRAVLRHVQLEEH